MKIIAGVLFLSVLVVGCGAPTTNSESKSETIVGADGTKVTTSDGNIKVEKDGKTSELGTNALTEEEMQLKFYPGAKLKPNSSLSTKTSTLDSRMQTLLSPDPPAIIADFYAKQHPELKFDKLEASAQLSYMASAEIGMKKISVVIARKDTDKETQIMLTHQVRIGDTKPAK